MATANKLTIECNGDIFRGFSWCIDNPKANIIIMEGMEEYCFRYNHFCQYLNECGFSIYAIDTYGQGQNINANDDNIGIWPKNGFTKQVDAYDALVCKLRESNLPVYIFAHSMGSYMCQDYLQRYANHTDKVVLCGSGSKNPAVSIGLLLAKMIVNDKNRNKKAKFLNNLMFGNFNKGIKNPKTDFDWLSYNDDSNAAYIKDPHCGFGPTNGFCLEFLKGMSKLYTKKGLNQLNKNAKLLIVTGKDDPVSSFSKSTMTLEKMYKKYGVRDVDIKIYENMRHEIHNEKNNKVAFKDIANFYLN